MENTLRVAGFAFLIAAIVGLIWTLPMPALTAAFFGLVLLFGGEVLARLGRGK